MMSEHNCFDRITGSSRIDRMKQLTIDFASLIFILSILRDPVILSKTCSGRSSD